MRQQVEFLPSSSSMYLDIYDFIIPKRTSNDNSQTKSNEESCKSADTMDSSTTTWILIS